MQELLNFEYGYLGLMFGTSWLHICLFQKRRFGNFKLNFPQFQKFEDEYAKYILCCALVVIIQWFSTLNIFDKYQ